VRTFPRELAEFRRMVEERGARLRCLSREELLLAGKQPEEHVLVHGRPATISIIVQPRPGDSLVIVVQGFMPSRLFRSLKNVAIDGFYKRSDGSVVEPLSTEDEYLFD